MSEVAEPAVLHPAAEGPAAWWAGLATIGLAAMLAGTALLGSWPLLAGVLIVQATLIVGWFDGIDAPGVRGGQVVVLGVALVADLVVVVPEASRPGLVVAPLGLAVLAAVAHQLARRGGRPRVVRSLTATTSAAILVALLAMLLPLHEGTLGPAALIAGVLAGGSAAAVVTLRLPGWSVSALALLAGPGVGAAVGELTSLQPGRGALLGLAAALAASVGAGVARGVATRVPALAAALPLATAGPAVYVVGRLLLG